MIKGKLFKSGSAAFSDAVLLINGESYLIEKKLEEPSLASEWLNADLASLLQLPVLLIVEDRLGCINQTLLNIEAIENRGLKLCAIVLNQPKNYDYLIEMDNFSDIKKRVDYEVIALKHNENTLDSMGHLVRLVLDQD